MKPRSSKRKKGLLVTGEMKVIRRGPVPTGPGLPLVTGEMRVIRRGTVPGKKPARRALLTGGQKKIKRK